MKTNLNLLKGVFILSLFIMTLTSCEKDEEPTEEDFTSAEIETSLSECLWYAYSKEDSSTRGLIFDFSNNNIMAYDSEKVDVLAEGNWEIENEVISFKSLNGDLEDYNGEWEVSRFWEGYIAIQKGDMDIEFEQDGCEL